MLFPLKLKLHQSYKRGIGGFFFVFFLKKCGNWGIECPVWLISGKGKTVFYKKIIFGFLSCLIFHAVHANLSQCLKFPAAFSSSWSSPQVVKGTWGKSLVSLSVSSFSLKETGIHRDFKAKWERIVGETGKTDDIEKLLSERSDKLKFVQLLALYCSFIPAPHRLWLTEDVGGRHVS